MFGSETLPAANNLFALGARAGLSTERRRTSGLVEQQRLFSLLGP